MNIYIYIYIFVIYMYYAYWMYIVYAYLYDRYMHILYIYVYSIYIYIYIYIYIVARKLYFYPRTGFYFRTCEDGAGWHLILYRISPRSEFFSQAYKNWHIMWGINLGLDWPSLARGSKFHTIHTPTSPLSSSPRQQKIWTYRF